jgi:hypothetical protein
MRFIKFSILTIILISGIFFFYPKEPPQTPLQLFDKNNQATDDVVKLLGLTGIRIQNDSLLPEKEWPEASLTLKSRSLEEITDAVQGRVNPEIAWKRSNNKERWEMTLTMPISEKQIQQIESIYTKLGFFNEAKPQTTTYRGILFLGSTLSSVRKRLAYLNMLIDSKNYNFSHIYVLSGERKLDKAIGESQESLLNPKNGEITFRSDWKGHAELPDNETDMIRIVFDQSKHLSLKNDGIIFVHTLKKEGQTRATTETTVYQWLEECHPESGLYLAISNQPYVLYQKLVIQKALLKAGRSDIRVQVVGPETLRKVPDGSQKKQSVAVLLDNLARIFYEMVEIKKMDPNNASSGLEK